MSIFVTWELWSHLHCLVKNTSLFQVETVEGLRDLQIPSGIQPGDTVKLSRMGVPNTNKLSKRGDHYFTVNVWIPKDIRFDLFTFLHTLSSKHSRTKFDFMPPRLSFEFVLLKASVPENCWICVHVYPYFLFCINHLLSQESCITETN